MLKNYLKTAGITCTIVPALAFAHNGEVKISGHVNQIATHSDDGHESTFLVGDHDASSTRLRVDGKYMPYDCLTVGSRFEMELEKNTSAKIGQLNNTNSTEVNVRRASAWFKHHSLGTITIGQDSTASDTTGEINASVGNVAYAGAVYSHAGGLRFHQSDSKDRVTTADPQVTSIFASIDGLGRDPLLRYDTPKFMGFHLATSYSSQTASTQGADIALYYNDTVMSNFHVKAAVAAAKTTHSDINAAKKSTIWDGSFAVTHKPTGFFLGGAFGKAKEYNQNDPVSSDPTNNHTKRLKYYTLGKSFDWAQVGPTVFALDYYHTTGAATVDDKGRSFGGGVIQKMSKYHSEVYLGARKLKYEKRATAEMFDNITVIYAGAKVGFALTHKV